MMTVSVGDIASRTREDVVAADEAEKSLHESEVVTASRVDATGGLSPWD